MVSLQKFLNDLSANKNLKGFVGEFQKLRGEFTKRGHEIQSRWKAEKTKTLKEVQRAVKTLNSSKEQLRKEVDKTITMIEKSAKDLEKNIEGYRKVAVARKAKLESMIRAQAGGSKKKSSRKKAKTSKKKTTRKTSR